jgi:hypothetical protein
MKPMAPYERSPYSVAFLICAGLIHAVQALFSRVCVDTNIVAIDFIQGFDNEAFVIVDARSGSGLF